MRENDQLVAGSSAGSAGSRKDDGALGYLQRSITIFVSLHTFG